MRCSLVFSAVALVASSSAAFAVNTVEASRVGYGLTQNICVTGSQIGGTFTFPVGQFVYNFRNGVGEGAFLNGDTLTFCTDLAQDVFPGYSLYNVVPLQNAPDPGPVMGAAKAQAIADVWAAFAGQQFTSTPHAAAMQMLVWEIVYDFAGTAASLDASNGNVRYQSTASTAGHFNGTLAIFNSFKTAVGTGGSLSTLRAVTNGDNQDQIVIVPAPGALALIGAAAFIAVRRNRPRSAK
jgi:hypothetical protein